MKKWNAPSIEELNIMETANGHGHENGNGHANGNGHTSHGNGNGYGHYKHNNYTPDLQPQPPEDDFYDIPS